MNNVGNYLHSSVAAGHGTDTDAQA